MPGRKLAGRLVRRGARRVLGRSNAWLALGGLGWVVRRARRVARRRGAVVHREMLDPGASLLIRVLDAAESGREHVD